MKLDRLKERYGGTSKIPQDELLQLGYVRVKGRIISINGLEHKVHARLAGVRKNDVMREIAKDHKEMENARSFFDLNKLLSILSYEKDPSRITRLLFEIKEHMEQTREGGSEKLEKLLPGFLSHEDQNVKRMALGIFSAMLRLSKPKGGMIQFFFEKAADLLQEGNLQHAYALNIIESHCAKHDITHTIPSLVKAYPKMNDECRVVCKSIARKIGKQEHLRKNAVLGFANAMAMQGKDCGLLRAFLEGVLDSKYDAEEFRAWPEEEKIKLCNLVNLIFKDYINTEGGASFNAQLCMLLVDLGDYSVIKTSVGIASQIIQDKSHSRKSIFISFQPFLRNPQTRKLLVEDLANELMTRTDTASAREIIKFLASAAMAGISIEEAKNSAFSAAITHGIKLDQVTKLLLETKDRQEVISTMVNALKHHNESTRKRSFRYISQEIKTSNSPDVIMNIAVLVRSSITKEDKGLPHYRDTVNLAASLLKIINERRNELLKFDVNIERKRLRKPIEDKKSGLFRSQQAPHQTCYH